MCLLLLFGWLGAFIGFCLVADSSTAEDKLKQGSIMVEEIRELAKHRKWILHEEAYQQGTELYINPKYLKIKDRDGCVYDKTLSDLRILKYTSDYYPENVLEV